MQNKAAESHYISESLLNPVGRVMWRKPMMIMTRIMMTKATVLLLLLLLMMMMMMMMIMGPLEAHINNTPARGIYNAAQLEKGKEERGGDDTLTALLRLAVLL